MEPGPELLMPLLPYQKEFLAWAVKQEQSPVRGGVLADEMGMGKTIQVRLGLLDFESLCFRVLNLYSTIPEQDGHG